MDYRGVSDLPEHTFLQAASKPDCSRTHDDYCQLPYYTALDEIFPPSATRWISVPSLPNIPKPLYAIMQSRSQPSPNLLNISITVSGGTDKASLHITPLNGYKLKEWSFTPIDVANFGRKSTYFVFMTYGTEVVEKRDIWVLLERPPDAAAHDPATTPSLEFAVATHYAHGPYQNSETLTQLRTLIDSRRRSPHHALGYWRWAITMIGSSAEIIVHYF